MNRQSLSSIIAILLGVAQAFALNFCWAYLAAYTPLPLLAHSYGLHGGVARAVTFPIDFFISVVLSLPAAWALTMLRPAKLSLYLLLAVLPPFLWLNSSLIGSPYFSQFFGEIALGWLQELFVLPVATSLMRLMLAVSAPNNSFKRTAAGRSR
jgi:hypothetical protein